jgi:hypothetical protein
MPIYQTSIAIHLAVGILVIFIIFNALAINC